MFSIKFPSICAAASSLAFYALASPAAAQSTNSALCGVASDHALLETLNGRYSLVLGPGTLSMMGNMMPFPQSDPMRAAIIAHGEGQMLLYTEEGLLRALYTVDASQKALAQIAPGTQLQAKFDELNAAACPNGGGSLPYTSGYASWNSADGVDMSGEYAMVFSMSQDETVHGWGLMQTSGGGADFNVQMVLDETQ